MLINPANATTAEAMLRDIPEAARAIGLQIQILNASTSREIEVAFATLVRDRADALFVAPDGFFASRSVQFATLATRYGFPAALSPRDFPEAGERRIFRACRKRDESQVMQEGAHSSGVARETITRLR